MDVTNWLNAATISGVHKSAGIPARNARDLETAEGGVSLRDAGAYVDVWVVIPEIF